MSGVAENPDKHNFRAVPTGVQTVVATLATWAATPVAMNRLALTQ